MPFGERGVAVEYRVWSGVEAAFLVEMVVDGRMGSGEFL